ERLETGKELRCCVRRGLGTKDARRQRRSCCERRCLLKQFAPIYGRHDAPVSVRLKPDATFARRAYHACRILELQPLPLHLSLVDVDTFLRTSLDKLSLLLSLRETSMGVVTVKRG